MYYNTYYDWSAIPYDEFANIVLLQTKQTGNLKAIVTFASVYYAVKQGMKKNHKLKKKTKKLIAA